MRTRDVSRPDDADIDDAVAGGVIAKMRNVGEACTAANRFHVAASVADEFASKLAEKTTIPLSVSAQATA